MDQNPEDLQKTIKQNPKPSTSIQVMTEKRTYLISIIIFLLFLAVAYFSYSLGVNQTQ